MSRHSKPWFRSARNAWYVKINGKQRFLGEHPEECAKPKKSPKGDWNAPDTIRDEFHKLMVAPVLVHTGTVWAVFDAFLDHSLENNAKRTYEFYQERLQRFKDAVPNMAVEALMPAHVYNWMKGKGWSGSYKRGVMVSLCRAFNWAVKARLILFNPIKGIEKPPETHRDQTLTQAEFDRMLGHVKGEAFRDVLKIIWLTGCRPFEAARVESRHVQKGLWKFPKSESKGKRRERIVILVPEAEKLTKKWATRNPDGPIFRNSRGRPWTAWAFDNRFKRLEEKIGYKVCTYALRHSYIHNGLTKGKLDAVTMATLAGHTTTNMIMKVYGHLLKDTKFMQAAARQAVAVR